uniref:Peptidase M48 domain-containing protein n=1 Tax=Aegilops tauschii subsp. strangulata TaxID=200361 RepID=A0A453BBR8_AEGTS
EAARRHTAHLDGLDWDVILVRDKEFRARSTPSGKIILHTGCFDLLKTDEEIASIIAHEVKSVNL